MRLSKQQVIRATTSSPFTRDFKHLLPFPHHWLKRMNWDDPKIKSVPPKDRIKYWNIVPGDTVVDRRDPQKILREVLAINKISNRVFLKPYSNVCDHLLLLPCGSHTIFYRKGNQRRKRRNRRRERRFIILAVNSFSAMKHSWKATEG